MGPEKGNISYLPIRDSYPTNMPQGENAAVVSIEQARLKIEQAARPDENAGLEEWVRYFDRHGVKKEGLPADWWNLTTKDKRQVGFVTKNQIRVLRDPNNKTEILDWVQKTGRDLEGFKLEFLSKHNVYPRRYVWNESDPTRLEDSFYGRNADGQHPDIVEITSDEERNGSAKESIRQARDFLKDSPIGSMVVVSSPLGPTGFVEQDGRGRDYIDSYFMIFVNQGDTVMNYTIKTDFKLPQMRDAILRLTGKSLEKGAGLEDYVRSVAKIKPGTSDGPQNIFDVVNILEDIQPSHAFRDRDGKQDTRTWEHVYEDIVQGERLYNFDNRTKKIISDFSKYSKRGVRPILDLQKGTAATILRMADEYFRLDHKKIKEVVLEEGKLYKPKADNYDSMDEVLKKTADIRGCSGGGSGRSIIFRGLFPRFTSGGSEENGGFSCPECGFKTTSPVGDKCPKAKGGCGLTKEQYARKSGRKICA